MMPVSAGVVIDDGAGRCTGTAAAGHFDPRGVDETGATDGQAGHGSIRIDGNALTRSIRGGDQVLGNDVGISLAVEYCAFVPNIGLIQILHEVASLRIRIGSQRPAMPIEYLCATTAGHIVGGNATIVGLPTVQSAQVQNADASTAIGGNLNSDVAGVGDRDVTLVRAITPNVQETWHVFADENARVRQSYSGCRCRKR